MGLDTSCYTTSLAVVTGEGKVAVDRRAMLPVPSGGLGIPPSKAVFLHLKQLPDLLAESKAFTGKLAGVAVSDRPRPVSGSYLPVFKVGEGYGKAVSAALGVPLLRVSHQEGHLEAGSWSAGGPKEAQFLALHLSGGTCEILRVRRQDGGYRIARLGGSGDISAGQLIDRLGVAMGLPFPAGPHLETAAGTEGETVSLPVAVRGYDCSFSGAETAAKRLLAAGLDRGSLCRGIFRLVAKSIGRLLREGQEREGLKEVLLVGGVVANRRVRREVEEDLGETLRLYWASPDLAGDNAVGVARLGVAIFGIRSRCAGFGT